MKVARLIALILGLALVSPVAASAYVENEYVLEMERQQNKEAIEREEAKEASEHEAAERAASEKAVQESMERKATEERERRELENRHNEEVMHAGEAAERVVEAAERAEQSRVARCVVPPLTGDSLSGAREALSRAHCRLGKVATPHLRHTGPFVVRRQSIRSGLARPSGTEVALTLGVAKHR